MKNRRAGRTEREDRINKPFFAICKPCFTRARGVRELTTAVFNQLSSGKDKDEQV